MTQKYSPCQRYTTWDVTWRPTRSGCGCSITDSHEMQDYSGQTLVNVDGESDENADCPSKATEAAGS